MKKILGIILLSPLVIIILYCLYLAFLSIATISKIYWVAIVLAYIGSLFLLETHYKEEKDKK